MEPEDDDSLPAWWCAGYPHPLNPGAVKVKNYSDFCLPQHLSITLEK